MMAHARHDILAGADADCGGGPGYLSDIGPSFSVPAVGAVTCVYRGAPLSARLADRLGAMFINEGFLPSVRIALLVEPLRYCFGATMAVRRGGLDAIGGVGRLVSYLAYD